MGKNIWVKPDFYSTKIINSPGFITLVHPKLTNKKEYIQELILALGKTKVNTDKPIVQEWRNTRGIMMDETEAGIPQFHLETSTRKWGELHAEVISVHCMKEDAQYLKYLLAEASSNDLVTQGVFVPTGIHLMEGKGRELCLNSYGHRLSFSTKSPAFMWVEYCILE